MSYSGDFVCTLQGNIGPILITAYPDETAVVVDGQLSFSNSQYTSLIGVTVTDSGFTDRSGLNSNEAIKPGDDLVVRNCILKNHYHGVLGGQSYKNVTLEGCLIYYNGNDTQLGHGAYVQHNDLGGLFTIRNCIIHNNFAYGIHCYGSDPLYDFLFENNVIYENGSIRSDPKRNILAGGTGGIYNTVIRGNKCWYRDTVAGEGLMVNWGPNTALNMTVQNNVVVGGSLALRLQNNPEITDMSGNEFYGTINPLGTDTTWPDNVYDTRANHPDASYVDIYPSDSSRANMTVFNPSSADNVIVDVSAFTTSGTVNAVNVLDPSNDVQVLSVVGGNITVNMQAVNRTVETPVGWTAPATTFPTFGCFILERNA